MISGIKKDYRMILENLSGVNNSSDKGHTSEEESKSEEGLKSDAEKKRIKRIFKYYRIRLMSYQHERLVHLIITMFVALFSLILLLLNYQSGSVVFLYASVPLIILTGFYICHYFRLENAVQAFEDLAEKFLSL